MTVKLLRNHNFGLTRHSYAFIDTSSFPKKIFNHFEIPGWNYELTIGTLLLKGGGEKPLIIYYAIIYGPHKLHGHPPTKANRHMTYLDPCTTLIAFIKCLGKHLHVNAKSLVICSPSKTFGT